ncbi:MAG: hypothetical protein P8R54_15710 [Myxococcota bacterium]|nr:hypothetical protein [Myxococcota bacterium]
MATMILTAVAFGLIAVAMGIGLILGGSPLKGSCGGKGGPECICDAFEQAKCRARDKMLAEIAGKQTG